MEELTLNYQSYTDSYKEQQDSICLCTSNNCSAYYLLIMKEKFNNQIYNEILIEKQSDKLLRNFVSIY